MGLFQKPPSTPEEVEAARPLEIAPDQVAEMNEDEWYASAYRGDRSPQLTIRAVAMGALLGFFLAFTNLYIGLKTGWHLGVALTACILSYAIWNGLIRSPGIVWAPFGFFGAKRTPMTILENNCMQSTASAAGYSTGGTFVSALAALLMISATDANPGGTHLHWGVYATWTFFLAVLGVVLAIPMKRNMINQERLKFPSGTAAAVTLQSLYSHGDSAVRKAKALMWAGFGGALAPLLFELKFLAGKTLMHGESKLFDWIPALGKNRDSGEGFKLSDWTAVLDHNPVMLAAGMLVGLRMTIWMMAGTLLLIFGLGPAAYDAAWTDPSGNVLFAASSPGKAWKEIGLWFGVPILVASGLLSFLLQWRTILRAFSGFGGDQQSDTDRAEVPGAWFVYGLAFATVGVVLVANISFGIPILYGCIAVALTFVLALVACRATGESDITPTGAMGKIMQLTFGVLMPQNATANLMSAGITAGAASSSADLLNDLKSGYLLGADPRRQFLAQFAGIFSGTIATVLGFYLMVPDATLLLGTIDPITGKDIPPEFPAPAAQAWKAVADVFRTGLDNMHPMHRYAIGGGLVLGSILVLSERFLPKYKKWLPSPTGFGLGFILPFQYPMSMFLGAFAAELWKKKSEKTATDYLVPIAAGVIAGVSILGVVVNLLNNTVFKQPL